MRNTGTGTVPRTRACWKAPDDGYPNSLISAVEPSTAPYCAVNRVESSSAICRMSVSSCIAVVMASPVVLCDHAIVLVPNGLGNDCRYGRSQYSAQLIDSSNKSLAEFTFASIEGQSFAPRGRHVSTAFATICWFNEIRLQLGAATPTDIQRILEPVDEEYEDPQIVRRRWRDYRSGVHAPTAKTVALSERRCSGATQILQSPLWDSLRLDRPATQVGLALAGRTCAEGDELLSRMLGAAGGLPNNPRWLKRRCTAVLLVGTLESLGVLTICMRWAGEAKLSHTAAAFYQAATRCLLILGPWLFRHGIARAIGEYYEHVLRPACCPDPLTRSGCFCSSYYLKSIEALDRMKTRVEEERGRTLESSELAHVILTELTLQSG